MNKLFKNIVGTVFTTEETPDKPVTNETPVLKKSPTNNSQSDFNQTPQTDYHPMQTVSIGDTQKYKDHFSQVMKDSNLPDPDYYEFNDSLESLAPVIPDIRTRIVSAFTVLAKNGLTKDKLLSSAENYITALDNDAQSFAGKLQQVRTNEIDAKKSKMEENLQKIQDLNAQIQQLQTENMSINQSVFESEQKLSSSQAGYNAELNNAKKVISDNINSIKTYLQ